MPPQTIDEIVIQLESIIQESIQKKERIGYFAVLYYKVTCQVRDGIKNNVFDDGPRMEKFDVIFANRFLTAWEVYKGGGNPGESWSVAFNATGKSSVLVLQQLLAGINAHINLDLGIAVAETMKGNVLSAIRGDFDQINTIISSLTYEIISDIDQVSPLISLMGLHANNDSSVLVHFTLENARDGAWCFAEELVTKTDAAYDTCILTRDRSIATLGQDLIQSKGAIKFTVWFIHLFEWKSVPRIIGVLSTYKRKYFKVL